MKNFTATFAAADDVLDLRFTVVNLTNQAEDIAIDEFKLTAVPEPASMLLLGLGGFCLVARRRK